MLKCGMVFCCQSADLRNWRASEPVEERALALCRVLTERGYLDGGQDTQEVAALMVQAAGAFSMQSSVSPAEVYGQSKCVDDAHHGIGHLQEARNPEL